MINTAYEFSFLSINQTDTISLESFKGCVMLIVNVASKCGFTKQYAELEALYQRYKDQGLVIVGVPCDNFGHQEPDTEEVIQKFCALRFGVTFYLTSKCDVIGSNAHPFYQWAKETLGFLAAPKWNFHKYLINREGELINYFYSATTPENKKFMAALESAIA